MRRASLLSLSVAVLGAALMTHGAAAQNTATCYNCPAEWADWGGQLRNIQRATGISVPLDNRNSGQVLAALIAEKSNPVADFAYLGAQFGILAKNAGVTAPYKPAKWDEIPADLKDPDGYWFTIHSGTLGFFVNKAALGNKPVPKSWKDLLKPEYRGMIGYLDPTSAAVGYIGVAAVNLVMGGSFDNFNPGLAYFKELQKNQPIVSKLAAYGRVLSGEIPILLDYDFNAYRAKYTDKAPVEFVIPAEGTVTVPYVAVLVKNGPHPENAKKVLDYIVSDEGQKHWASAYMRPVRASTMTPETAAKFLPASEYARSRSIDLAAMAKAQSAFTERWQKEIQ